MQPVANHLPPPLQKLIYRHAMAEWPHEACGFIVGDQYVPVPNTSPDPENAFELDAASFAILQGSSGLPVILVHTHTQGQKAPSRADMEAQAATGVPWLIVVLNGDGHVVEHFWFPVDLGEPLEGLPFREGVRDCYTHIRKYWYQVHGVVLPEFPRDSMWWNDGEDLYVGGFEKAGFRALAPEEIKDSQGTLLLQPGDVGLTRVLTQAALNHGMVYTGGLMISHHLPERLARPEPLARWFNRVELWLRYTANEQNSPARSPEG
jgi:proteasome lid subunit RPN8/RPN11